MAKILNYVKLISYPLSAILIMVVETRPLLYNMKRIYSQCSFLIEPAREKKQKTTKPKLSIYDAIHTGIMETRARSRTTYVINKSTEFIVGDFSGTRVRKRRRSTVLIIATAHHVPGESDVTARLPGESVSVSRGRYR